MRTLEEIEDAYSFLRDPVIGDAIAMIKELKASLRLIADHPVDESKQWEVGCKEMKKVARLALGEKKDD